MTTASTKKRLARAVTSGIDALGFQALEGPGGGAAALFYKRCGDLILLLGLELSRLYDERFTASFYLSFSFEWAYMLPGYPRNAYRRIGGFLTAEERARLLDQEFLGPGVVDAWWIGFQAESISHFVEAVRLTEPRFMAQPGLEGEIRSCEEEQKHMNKIRRVISMAQTLRNPPPTLHHQPKRRWEKVSPSHYWAAEMVLAEEEPQLISSQYVQLLAVDSFRVAHLVTARP
jgi:hypothetical protein